MSQQQPRRRWGRIVFLTLAFVGGAALAGGAAYLYRTVPVRRVEVEGATRASRAELLRLAALPDSVAMADVDPRLVADRLQRHPWVRHARVRRMPTGTLAVRLEERTPAALVLGHDGRPQRYLDAEGHAMPLPVAAGGRPAAVYDVPLLRGSVPEAPPTRAVESASVVELLAALAAAPPDVDALVSEVSLGRGGDATLLTTPVSGHPGLTVRLGIGGYAEKLRRLRAFFDQAVLPRPGHPFEVIDLRFDGQVVTREGDLGLGSSDLGNAADSSRATTPERPTEPIDSSEAH
ncbi:MAG TPA: FtsQ-type POTRA domain-containing protein [Rhodothermales bacterium]|nr:FtsQ-type POTRA domain-containing protein [Rhodothermales bacterium]